MLPTVGFFLAAVLVMTGLLPYAELPMVIVLVSTVGLAAIYKRYHVQWGRVAWMSAFVVCMTINMALFAWWAEVPLVSQLLCYGTIGVFVLLACISRIAFITLINVCLPCCGLVHIWVCFVVGMDPAQGIQFVLWSLATWPMLALMSQGRYLLLTVLSGSLILPFLLWLLIADTEVPFSKMVDTLLLFWQHSSSELTVIQCVLVVVSVAPLLIHAAALWRWVAVSGLLLIVGPLAVLLVTGPWYGQWPSLIWYVVYPAFAALSIGVIGMLCTVRRPELLADTAVRGLSLGIGASAVLILPFLEALPERAELLIQCAQVLSPLIWAILLACFIAIAALIARSGEAEIISTESWEQSRGRIAVKLGLRLSSFLNEYKVLIKEDTHKLLNPSSFVPFLFFCSTIPMFYLLDDGTWMSMGLLFVGFLISRMYDQSVLLWGLAQIALLTITAYVLHISLLIMLAVLAPLTLILFLFVRWPSWNAAWAYTAAVLCLTLVHVPLTMMQGQDPMPVLLCAGVLCLLCNGLQDGIARWVFVPLCSVMILIYISWWVARCDPFAMLMSNDQTQEWWSIIYCVPVLWCILYVLMWSRSRIAAKQHVFTRSLPWQQHLLSGVAIASVVAWCLGWRPQMLGFVCVCIVMLLNLRSMVECLKRMRRELLVWALLDVMTLLLASLILVAGDCYEFFLHNQRSSGTLQAGSLGRFVSIAERDCYACLLAFAMVLLSLRFNCLLTLRLCITSRLAAVYSRWRPAADSEASHSA